MSPLHDYIAGAIAGSAGVIAGHPFDTVKVQLQIQGTHNRYKSLLDCVTTVQKQNLAKGFFRGLSWPLLSYGVINSVFFGVYGNTLKVLNADSSGKTAPSYSKIFLAGCIGGIAQLIPACPIEVIKVVLQSQIPHGIDTGQKFYKGPLQAASDIIRKQGPSGMYRGLPTQFVRDVPASATYFVVFEFLTYESSRHFPGMPSMLGSFIFGGITGVISWALIIPFDVLKSRIQADSQRKLYTGFFDCAVKGYKEHGIKLFFRGLSLTSLRAFPVNGVTLMVHIEIMRWFGQVKYAENSA